MADDPQTPPGWFPNPTDPSTERYWDGRNWSPQTRPRPGISAPTLAPAANSRRPSSPTWVKVMVGLVLAGVVGLIGCAGIVLVATDVVTTKLVKSAHAGLTPAQYRELQIGTPESEITARYGSSQIAVSTNRSPLEADCRVYFVKNRSGRKDLQTAASWVLCFDQGELVFKQKY